MKFMIFQRPAAAYRSSLENFRVSAVIAARSIDAFGTAAEGGEFGALVDVDA